MANWYVSASHSSIYPSFTSHLGRVLSSTFLANLFSMPTCLVIAYSFVRHKGRHSFVFIVCHMFIRVWFRLPLSLPSRGPRLHFSGVITPSQANAVSSSTIVRSDALSVTIMMGMSHLVKTDMPDSICATSDGSMSLSSLFTISTSPGTVLLDECS